MRANNRTAYIERRLQKKPMYICLFTNEKKTEAPQGVIFLTDVDESEEENEDDKLEE